MEKGFTFDGALMFPFRAAHARSFLWIFALSFAAISTVLSALMLYLARDAILGFFDTMDSLIEASETAASEQEEMAAVGTMFSAMARMLPWLIPVMLVSWIVWVMFETASQRRYIRDEAFSLRFGADELRMLGTSFFWFLLQGVIFAIPMMTGLSVFWSMMALFNGGITEEEFARNTIGTMGLTSLSMLVLFPLYVFLATRFSPCFGLTIKDRKIAFLDAWTVSHGRFWPILGAFVIIMIGGAVAGYVVSGIGQAILMPVLMNSPFLSGDVPQFHSLLTPGFLAAMLAYSFLRYFLQGLMMHIADGPAAFAARHDPRGGVDDALKVSEFD